MNLRLIAVPYDSAIKDVRMGAGPACLLEAGLPMRLSAAGHRVEVEWVHPETPQGEFPAEIRTAFDIARVIAERVAAAREEQALPIVLAGNCNTALGTVAGLNASDVGVLWFDAHADFNTPETTTSGFLDGMSLAMLVGRCWAPLAETIPGFTPVAEDRVLLLGVRDVDPAELALLSDSGVRVLAPAAVREDLETALDRLARTTREVYVHLDLDALDPGDGRANRFAAADGLGIDELERALTGIARRFSVCAVAATAYDPAMDRQRRVPAAAARLLGALLADDRAEPQLGA
ncbi:MAG: arginase family protein [Longimicrobiales bacterium]